MKNDKCALLPAPGLYVQAACDALNAVAQGPYQRTGKGIRSADMVDLQTNTHLGRRFVVASGKHVKPPALMYHCPFCGEPLVRLTESS